MTIWRFAREALVCCTACQRADASTLGPPAKWWRFVRSPNTAATIIKIPSEPLKAGENCHGLAAAVQRPNSNAPQARNMAEIHTKRRKLLFQPLAADGRRSEPDP
jgi:hypothetical protein